MRRADFRVRPLNDKDNSEFQKLIQSDQMSSFSSLQPDHNLNFYKKIGDGPPSFWGVFNNEQLVGTCGFVPLKIQWPFPQISTFYQSDSLVLDSHRGGPCFPLLAEAQCRYFTSIDSWPMGFGIENEPYALDGLAPLTKRYGITTRFIGETRLTEIYLTKKLSAEPQHPIHIGPLKDAKNSIIEAFLNAHTDAHKLKWQVPAYNMQTLEKISAIDSNAQIYLYGSKENPVAGALSCDTSAIKALRYYKKSLLIETARASREFINTNVEFVRYKILSGCWSKEGHDPQLGHIIRQAYIDAFEQNYDALSMRDIADEALPADILDRVLGTLPNILHYSRRVCVMTRAQDQDVLKDLKTAPWNFDAFIV